MTGSVRRAQLLLEHHKIRTYWTIGGKINAYLNGPELPAGKIGPFYLHLSQDLGVHDRTLQQCEQFFRYFPDVKTCLKIYPDLRWSHYRFLLVEPDAKKRFRWMKRIETEHIPADRLRLILKPHPVSPSDVDKMKPPVRGRLYTYRLLAADDIGNFDVPWFVDLGFRSRREAPPAKGVLNNKYVYVSEKTGQGYRLKASDALASDLFTFRAVLRRVVDGDTLLVVVDQGFSCWSEHRLRLKGINAPEPATLDGQRSKQWVENELAHTKEIVVKTYHSDEWDRYLADVFYPSRRSGKSTGPIDLPAVAAEGLWLNGRIVDAAMADVYK
ncbi:MAG: hypothetical protein HQL24_08720 [Candidatus Omnitrophica bacterium]|nr:hypothetical protein [Candidatus Omnitrophota bacterium]